MVIINVDNNAKIKKGREVDERLEQNQNTTIPRSMVKIKDTHIYTHRTKECNKRKKDKRKICRKKGQEEGMKEGTKHFLKGI